MDVQFKIGAKGSIPTIQGLAWTSSDPSVFTVTSGPTGSRCSWEAKKIGKVTITAMGGTDFVATLQIEVHA